MRVGVTGTRKGMSERQVTMMHGLLSSVLIEEVHHGDCIGVDEQVHDIALRFGITTIVHPPSNDTLRAFCEADVVLEPKDYITRNHDIVDSVDVLFVVPYEYTEQRRSGTWATYRYAKKQGVEIHLILPNGHIRKENV